MTTLNMVQAIRGTLEREMERDERIILLGQDIGRNGGMFRATDRLQQRFGEARVVDMPLAEGVIVGSAVGLACSGLRPIPEIQFLGFASQAFHQLEGQVALPQLVRRFPRMEPAYTEPSWVQRFTIRGVDALPVILR